METSPEMTAMMVKAASSSRRLNIGDDQVDHESRDAHGRR
jgi:hypothetical protein